MTNEVKYSASILVGSPPISLTIARVASRHRVRSASLPSVVATLASTRALIIARRTRPLAVSTAVAAALNVALNLLLVPQIFLLLAEGFLFLA